MNKLGVFVVTSMIAVCTMGITAPTEASYDAYISGPLVSVQDKTSVDSILKKPSDNEMILAKMQWIKGVPRNKLGKVYMSVVFDEGTFSKLKDDENLAFGITNLIDREFKGTGIKITPYANLAKKAKSNEELLSSLKEFDSGITIVVEKQTDGEVIMRGYLETPEDQLTFANYTARSLYGKEGTYDAKVFAFVKALRGFIDEIEAYKAGEVKF